MTSAGPCIDESVIAVLARAGAAEGLTALRNGGLPVFSCGEVTECVELVANSGEGVFLLDVRELGEEASLWIEIILRADLGPLYVLVPAAAESNGGPDGPGPGADPGALAELGIAGLLPASFLAAGVEVVRPFLALALDTWRARRDRRASGRGSTPGLESLVRDCLHEFRTPLTTILEFCSLMADGIGGEVSDKHRTYLGYMSAAGTKLAQNFDDFRDIVRMRLGAWPGAEQQPTSVVQVALAAASVVRDDRLEVVVEAEDGLEEVHVDGSVAKPVFVRLVQYAAKVCARPSRLRICARRDRDEVLFEVRFEGSVAPAQDSRLLEEEVVWHDGYYKSVTKVFGVGVQFARDLVGGEPTSIALAPDPGGGCVLSFRAPVVACAQMAA